MIGQLKITPQELEIVKKILEQHVPEYAVRAFGSRVYGKARQSSDLDLAVMTDVPLEILRMVNLKEAFSESDLPFKVDIIDWAETSENFREIIEREYVMLKETGKSIK